MLTAYMSSFPAGGETSSASIQGLHGPAVRARLESGPWAAAHSPLAERNGFLQLQLHDYTASFMMSSLRNLSLFLEDDSASQVLPMEISIRDTHIDLKVKRLISVLYFAKFVLPRGYCCRTPTELFQWEICLIASNPVLLMEPITHCLRLKHSLVIKLNILNSGLIGIWIWTKGLMTQKEKAFLLSVWFFHGQAALLWNWFEKMDVD